MTGKRKIIKKRRGRKRVKSEEKERDILFSFPFEEVRKVQLESKARKGVKRERDGKRMKGRK